LKESPLLRRLTSLPAYTMQICWYPQYAHETLDKTVCNFIWHGEKNGAMDMVCWNKIMKPRKIEGLGVQPARLQNKTLLGKLVWSLVQLDTKVRVSILADKYLKHGYMFLEKEKRVHLFGMQSSSLLMC